MKTKCYFIKVKDCLSGTQKGKMLAEYLLEKYDGMVIPCQVFLKEIDSVIAVKIDELDSLHPDIPFVMESSFRKERNITCINNLLVHQGKQGASVELTFEMVREVREGGAV